MGNRLWVLVKRRLKYLILEIIIWPISRLDEKRESSALESKSFNAEKRIRDSKWDPIHEIYILRRESLA